VQSFFLGRYDYAMDGRGRVPVPPRYRSLFAGGAVLSQGSPDPCLRLYTIETFQQQASRYVVEPPLRRSGKIVRYALFGGSFDIELDGQGRILIPPPLRAYAGLETNVVMMGTGESLAIWNPEQFQAYMASIEGEIEATFETVEPGS